MEQASPDEHHYGGFAEEPSRELTDNERLDALRLIRSENIGPITYHQLIKRFQSPTKALEVLPELSRLGGKANAVRLHSIQAAEKELATTEKLGAELITFGESRYPTLLGKIDVPPPLLCVKGDLSILDRPAISIVGSRNGSAAGKQFTRNIARELGQLGYVITSGLARGIDTAAHEASLESGTIAVVAGGIDILYPPENADLQKAIGETGVLVSENAIGFKPRGKDFPRRNRIISGLAHATLVIEAALKSGSLITSRYALEHGREVFAAPGSPLDARAAGTNMLLKRGANILTCADDVTEVLAPMLRSLPLYMKTEPETISNEFTGEITSDVSEGDRQKVLLALGPTPVDVDELIRCTGLSAGIIQMVLMELDLAGRLERHGRQMVSLMGSERQGRLI